MIFVYKTPDHLFDCAGGLPAHCLRDEFAQASVFGYFFGNAKSNKYSLITQPSIIEQTHFEYPNYLF